MSKNSFTVDLGSLKISDQQRTSINSAIQKAVAGELANIGQVQKIVLVPVNDWKIGPIINGIIARDLTKELEGALNLH